MGVCRVLSGCQEGDADSSMHVDGGGGYVLATPATPVPAPATP